MGRPPNIWEEPITSAGVGRVLGSMCPPDPNGICQALTPPLPPKRRGFFCCTAKRHCPRKPPASLWESQPTNRAGRLGCAHDRQVVQAQFMKRVHIRVSCRDGPFPEGSLEDQERPQGGHHEVHNHDYRNRLACKLLNHVCRCSHPEKECGHGSTSGSVPGAG
jgi:hypothetical protein